MIKKMRLDTTGTWIKSDLRLAQCSQIIWSYIEKYRINLFLLFLSLKEGSGLERKPQEKPIHSNSLIHVRKTLENSHNASSPVINTWRIFSQNKGMLEKKKN